VYFRSSGELEHFRRQLKENQKSFLIDEGTSHYCDYYSITRPGKPTLKVQLVKFEFYANPEAVIDSFDFTICQCLWNGKRIITGKDTLTHIALKQLHPHKLRYPVTFMRRFHKYESRGYHMFNDTMAFVLKSIVANPDMINDYSFYAAPVTRTGTIDFVNEKRELL
jgi:hypothetical protein